MNLFFKTAAPLLVLLNLASTHAMQQTETKPAVEGKIAFDLYAHNTTSRTISIIWVNKRGNSKTKLIEAGKKEFIAKYADLQTHYPIKFTPYGEWFGYSAVSAEAPFSCLSDKWLESKKNADDNLLLTITTSRIIYLDLQYNAQIAAIQQISRAETSAEKALELFPRLSKYPEVLASLTNDKVLGFERWDQEVVPATYLSRATTAEDVYRYILALPTTYTEAMVKENYRKLATEFHPDKMTQNVALAQAAFTLITKAYEELLKALKAKRGSGDWVVVEEDN